MIELRDIKPADLVDGWRRETKIDQATRMMYPTLLATIVESVLENLEKAGCGGPTAALEATRFARQWLVEKGYTETGHAHMVLEITKRVRELCSKPGPHALLGDRDVLEK